MKKILVISILAIILSVSITTVYAQNQYQIPAWVKGVAGFWAEEKITDSEFGDGLSFLIDNEIIKVPLIQELQNKVNTLQSENADLRSQLNLPELNASDSQTCSSGQTLINGKCVFPITISVTTDKLKYNKGDTILVTGKLSGFLSDYPVALSVIAPSGDIVALAQIDVGSDKKFSTEIIVGGTLTRSEGTYTIEVNYAGLARAQTTYEFGNSTGGTTNQGTTDGLRVSVSKGTEIQGFGKSLNIKVINAVGTVQMNITSSNLNVIETLLFPPNSKGEISQPWFIPEGLAPGIYTIKVKDSSTNIALADFIIE